MLMLNIFYHETCNLYIQNLKKLSIIFLKRPADDF